MSSVHPLDDRKSSLGNNPIANPPREENAMLKLLLWLVLLVFCWPLALAILVLWPFLWLLSIPFRVLGIVVESLLALAFAVLMLPARLLGGLR
jgi:hypothetical protein